MNFKKITTAIASILLLFIAMPVFAMTQAEKDALIQQIRQQIAVLQAQLNAQNQQAVGNWCHTFTTNLGFASSGSDDVSALHVALYKSGISYGADHDSLYTADTAAAVGQFQAQHGISSTGFVGALTRKTLNALYSCPPLTLIYPNGGETLHVGDTVRITWDASGLTSNDTLTISAYNPSSPYVNVKTITSGVQASQGYYDWNLSTYSLPSTSYPAYIRIKIQVRNKNISVASAGDSTVNAAGSQSANSINLVYPNGGQILYVGDTARITWNSQGLTSSDQVTVSIYPSSTPYSNVKILATSVPATQGYYDWNISAFSLPSTSYPLQLRARVEVTQKNISSYSSGDFTVNSPSASGSAAISIIYPAGGETFIYNTKTNIGDSPRIAWNTTGFTSSDQVTITVHLVSAPYLNVKTIASSVSATTGYYDWNISTYNLPQNSGTFNLYVQIDSASRNISVSSKAFTVNIITPPPAGS